MSPLPPFCLCMADPCTCLTGDPRRLRPSELADTHRSWVLRVLGASTDPRGLLEDIRRACVHSRGCGECDGCLQLNLHNPARWRQE